MGEVELQCGERVFKCGKFAHYWQGNWQGYFSPLSTSLTFTPTYRCARNQHHVEIAPSSSSSSSKWTELSSSFKQSIFSRLQSALGHASSCSVDEAERELKSILKDSNITTQGAADKKLREFCAFSGMSISGLGGSVEGVKRGRESGREEESVRDLLHRAIELHTRAGGMVSVSSVYAMFGM